MNESLNREEALHFLKQCQLFASLADEDLSRILEECTLESYGPGAEIFRANDPSDKIYIIKSGVVEICRTDPNSPLIAVVAYLGERETLGEMSILTGSRRSSLVRVPESAELLAISRDDFMGLLEGIPIILVLPTRVPVMISKAHLLVPRFIHYTDVEFSNVGAVLKKIMGRINDEQISLKEAIVKQSLQDRNLTSDSSPTPA